MEKPSLSSDWTLILSVMIFMGALLIVAKVNSQRAKALVETLSSSKKEFLVEIQGAVARPGSYMVSDGTSLGKVLRKARPSKFADLSKFFLHEAVTSPLKIDVEELKVVSIRVEGAVKSPVELIVPIKTRICDIKSKVALTKEADLRFFKRRRMLKDQEVLEVPKKTVE